MPGATFVGSPASGAKTLRRVDYATERNGLETLTETYTIRTADRAAIQPAFLTSHNNFSTSSTKYERMAVENFAFRAQDGDISELTVTYVGLTSANGLPGALVRLLPSGSGFLIQAEYITTQSESELIEQNKVTTRMPTSINGTLMPANSKYFQTKDNSFTFFGFTYSTTDAVRRGQFVVATVVFQQYVIGL